LHEARRARDAYTAAFGDDFSSITGEAKIFKEQIDALRAGEIAALLNQINDYAKAFT
jgi:hypothetical protein